MVAERLFRWFGGPIRGRTTAVAAVVVGLALGLGGFALVSILRAELEHNLRASTELLASDVAALIRTESIPKPVYFQGESAGAVQVVTDDAQHRVLVASRSLEGESPIAHFALAGPGPEGHVARGLPLSEGDRFYVVALRAQTPQGRVLVYSAAPFDRVDRVVHSVTLALLGGIPVLLALVGLTTWLVTGRVLRPVESIRMEVAEISDRDLHRRVPVSDRDDEIARLAHTMNDMLDRLDGAANRQRRFVADASHELRSPLTSIRTQLEVGLAHPDRTDWAPVIEDVLIDQTRVERLVKDMLLMARLDSVEVALRRAPVDLGDLVRAELGRRPLGRVPINLAATGPAVVSGDPDQLAQVLRNLVDNAEHHAETTVDVTVGGAVATTLPHHGSSLVTLVVADDGPGVPTDARERIFEPFSRMDHARASADGGSGLGLAIVRDIVANHDGTIYLAESLKGARFVVELPAQR